MLINRRNHNSLNHSFQKVNTDGLFVVSCEESLAVPLNHAAFTDTSISDLKFQADLVVKWNGTRTEQLTMTTFMAISNSSSLIIIAEASLYR